MNANFLTTPQPHEEAARYLRNKPVVTRAVFDALAPELQARAFVVTGVEALDAVARVRELTARLPLGGDYDDLKEEILAELSPWLVTSTDPEERAKELGAATRRAEMLLRMHGWQTYARTQHALMEANRDVFPFRQYLSSEDSRVRPSHAALNRKVLPADHPFWANHTPPWEFGCRCDVVPLTQDEVDEIAAGEAGKPPEDREVMPPAQVAEIENNGRIVKPGGQGFLDIRTPRERNGEGYEWRPGDDPLPIEQILERFTTGERAAFVDFAGRQRLEDGRTLLDWWKSGAGDAAGPEPDDGEAAAGVAAVVKAAAGAVLKAPVSAAVTIAAKGRVKTVWKEALKSIDKVHDDGELAPSKAIRAAKNANHLGAFYPGTLDLALKDDGSWMHLTAAHELGHYLDHQALGVKGKWASTDPTHPAYEVIDLLKQTPTIAEIEAAPMGGNRKAYFTQRLEIWARAYAQFVAEESEDEALLKNLKKVRESVEPWRQWPTEEFAPARAAIRRMFVEKGWMKADEKEVER